MFIFQFHVLRLSLIYVQHSNIFLISFLDIVKDSVYNGLVGGEFLKIQLRASDMLTRKLQKVLKLQKQGDVV